LKGINLLILLAVIVTLGFVAYVQMFPPSAKPEPNACPTCLGHKQLKCPACGGFGRVDQKQVTTCEQCLGSGKYHKKLHDSTVTCPFCNGTGNITTTNRVVCAKCRELGWIVCPACNGTGFAPKEPGFFDSVLNWFR
jgi:DnaJ-class molecular chaperone